MYYLGCRTKAKKDKGNPTPNKKCVFPFKWSRNGKTYKACTTDNNNGVLWCGVQSFVKDELGWGACDPQSCKKGMLFYLRVTYFYERHLKK